MRCKRRAQRRATLLARRRHQPPPTPRRTSFARIAATGARRSSGRSRGRSDFVSEVDTAAEQRIRDARGAARCPTRACIGEELSPARLRRRGHRVRRRSARRHDELPARLSRSTPFDRRRSSTASRSRAWSLNVAHRASYSPPSAAAARRATASRSASATSRSPSRALIGTGFPFKHPEQIDQYIASSPASCARRPAFAAPARRRSTSATSPAAASTRSGSIRLAPWDVAAGLLMSARRAASSPIWTARRLALARSGSDRRRRIRRCTRGCWRRSQHADDAVDSSRSVPGPRSHSA